MASEGVGQGKTLTLSLRWLSSHKKDHPSVEPELTAQRFLLDLLLDTVDGNTCQIDMVTISCFTEHRRGDHIYRAHPDYHKGGPWYDWAYVEFGPDDTGEESYLYPAQMACCPSRKYGKKERGTSIHGRVPTRKEWDGCRKVSISTMNCSRQQS
jgi:hypothetical protein